MALSTEQRSKIKQRAQELITGGMEKGPAAQQAFSEIVGTLADVPAQPAPREQQVQATRSNLPVIQLDVEDEEAKFVRRRSTALEKVGFGPDEAESIARKEFTEQFKEPLPPGFGGLETRKKEEREFLAPEAAAPIALDPEATGQEASLVTALRPQTFLPEDKGVIEAEEARLKKTAKATTSGVGIDWEKVQDLFEDNLDLKPEDAADEVSAFREVYESKLVELEKKDITGIAASEQAFEEAAQEIQDIGARMQDKASYIKDVPEDASQDPWIRAFSRQETVGEGIPDLTQSQRQYLNRQIDARRQKKFDELKATKPSKTVMTLRDGTEIDAIDYDPELHGAVETKSRDLTDEEILAQAEGEIDKPWWLDEQKRTEAIIDPEAVGDRGIFTDTSALGTTRETTTGWLLRAAMAPLNMVAGAASEAVLRGGALPEARERKREEKAPAFKEHPILLNIAENRGFVGEFQEAADIVGAEGVPYYIIVGGGFAADMLDPTLDVAKGLGTAARTARQVSKGRKALGLVPEGALQLGLKAGVNDFLDASVVSSLVKPRFEVGDVRNILVNQTDAMLQASDAARRAGTAPPTMNPGKKKLVDEATEVSEALDDLAGGGAGKAVRKKELARQLGALARVDDDARKVMKAVDRAVSRGQRVATRLPKVNRYVQALKAAQPDSYERLRKGLLRDVASRNVYTATKDMNAFDNLVALTKNTWAGKKDAAAIMKRAGDSEIGKLGKEIAETDVSYKVVRPSKTITSRLDIPSAPIVAPVYKLTQSQKNGLARVAEELKGFRKLDQVSLDMITDQLNRGFISTTNLRRLIDGNIDLVAEGMAGAGKEVARARDVARLDIGIQRDLLVPLESRAFTRQALKQWLNKMTGKTSGKSPNMSIGQQQLLREAQQRASSLDVNLRNNMKRVMQDADYREALTGSRAEITREQALAHLIVGPKGDIFGRVVDEQRIREILDFTNSQMFFTKNTREDIFDMFSGVNFKRETSLLTEKGQKELEAFMAAQASTVARDPSQLWAAVKNTNDEMRRILATNDPSLVRDQEGLVDVFTKNQNKIPPEVQVGSYYKSEADRIVKGMLNDLVNTEIGKANLDLMDAFDTGFQKKITDAAAELGLPVDINQIAPAIITRRIIRQILVPNYRQTALQPGDIINAFDDFLNPQDKRDALRILNQKIATRQADDIMTAFDALFEHADDIAAGIRKRNDLSSQPNLANTIDALRGGFEGDQFAQLKTLFGTDIANQLKNEFRKGSDQLRSELRDFVHRRYEDKSNLVAIKHKLEDLLHLIEATRYNLLLNMRPRFHGTNMMTAMDIVYNTTGRLPARPLKYMDEVTAMYKDSNPARVIATDSAGRSYTAGELRDILTETGGRTVFDLQTPSARTSKVLNEIDDRAPYVKFNSIDPRKWEGTIGGKANRFRDSFKELPLMEDMMVRYMVLRTALDEGRSLDEAIALARKSMFDIGDITKYEKQFQRLALFYGFTRNNFVNMVKNLAAGPKGWKRIAATAKVKRGAEAIAPIDEQERRYAPSYAQTRILLGTRPFGERKDVTLAGPMIPTLDAVHLFGEMMKLQFVEIGSGMLHPSYKKALGVQSPFDREIKQIPPEHVAMMKSTQVDPIDIIEFIAGGTVVPQFGKPTDGAVGGVIYPLTTPEQRRRYKLFVDTMNYTGISSPTTDFARTFFPEGTSGTGRGLGEFVAFAVGAATPLKTLSPEEQAYYDSLDRLKAARQFNKEMEKLSVKEAQVEETKEEKVERKELGEKRRAKPRAIAKVKDTKQRKIEIKEEIGRIKWLLKSGQISKTEAKDRLSAMKKEVAELNRIEREQAKQ